MFTNGQKPPTCLPQKRLVPEQRTDGDEARRDVFQSGVFHEREHDPGDSALKRHGPLFGASKPVVRIVVHHADAESIRHLFLSRSIP